MVQKSDEKWWEMDGLSMLQKLMDSPGKMDGFKKPIKTDGKIDVSNMAQKSDDSPGKMDGFKKPMKSGVKIDVSNIAQKVMKSGGKWMVWACFRN